LIATIKSIRPDLLSDVTVTASPIPVEMPSHFKQPSEFVEGIGEPINACFLTEDVDPTGWYDDCEMSVSLSLTHTLTKRWMFEKFDGVRGFWNPHQKTFFSRTGKPFLFPSHIISLMPNLMLDGELW
jgi:hypothetical protein